MLYLSVLCALVAPLALASSDTVALYWGQNNGEQDLAAYCQSGQGVNILILSFLDNFGCGTYPNGNFGECTVNSDGSFSSGCSDLASDIATCQAAGVKVFLSSGGYGANWCLSGTSDAAGVASSLWNSYANPSVTSGMPRPFGNVAIDGWDFDIESQEGSSYTYLGDLVNSLRGYFSSDTSKSYYISGAPQCPAPDANMNDAIQAAQFDYLFIQFYNNPCAANDLFQNSAGNPDGPGGSFNLDVWPGTISGGASSGASLLVGIPASTSAANSWDFVTQSNLPALVQNASTVAGFGGIMVWQAVYSDEETDNGYTYAEEVSCVLQNGSLC